MRITRWFAGSLMVALVACGGGDSPSAPTPTPVPTPTPISYSGTYSGPMVYTSPTGGTLTLTGTTTVTHTAGLVSLTNLTTSGLASVTFPLGTAPYAGTFDGSISYNSSGCGVITSKYHGYFGLSGTVAKMNLQVTLTPTTITSACGVSDIRGELTRG